MPRGHLSKAHRAGSGPGQTPWVCGSGSQGWVRAWGPLSKRGLAPGCAAQSPSWVSSGLGHTLCTVTGPVPLVTDFVTPQAASCEHPGLCPSLGLGAAKDDRTGGQVPRVLARRWGPGLQQEALPRPQGTAPWQWPANDRLLLDPQLNAHCPQTPPSEWALCSCAPPPVSRGPDSGTHANSGKNQPASCVTGHLVVTDIVPKAACGS